MTGNAFDTDKGYSGQDYGRDREAKEGAKAPSGTVAARPGDAPPDDRQDLPPDAGRRASFDPKTGEVRASGKDDIAAWFIDTDYDEESFFVRHAYFMGANDPYKSLKTALKAEIDEDAWATLYRDKSRPFPRPDTGRFAVKVINHFGDEVMKVFAV